MARAGQRANAGQEIRLADIEADAGCNMGIFEKLHHHETPAAFALTLKEVSSRYYGAVGLAWLRHIVANQHAIHGVITKEIESFLKCVVIPNGSGQMLRVARRFALVAATGELATQYGLTGWLQGESFRAAYECFKTWLFAFGWQGNREDRAILSQVRSLAEVRLN